MNHGWVEECGLTGCIHWEIRENYDQDVGSPGGKI